MCCKHWGSVEPCCWQCGHGRWHHTAVTACVVIPVCMYVPYSGNVSWENFLQIFGWRAICKIFSVNILHFYAWVRLYTCTHTHTHTHTHTRPRINDRVVTFRYLFHSTTSLAVATYRVVPSVLALMYIRSYTYNVIHTRQTSNWFLSEHVVE